MHLSLFQRKASAVLEATVNGWKCCVIAVRSQATTMVVWPARPSYLPIGQDGLANQTTTMATRPNFSLVLSYSGKATLKPALSGKYVSTVPIQQDCCASYGERKCQCITSSKPPAGALASVAQVLSMRLWQQ